MERSVLSLSTCEDWVSRYCELLTGKLWWFLKDNTPFREDCLEEPRSGIISQPKDPTGQRPCRQNKHHKQALCVSAVCMFLIFLCWNPFHFFNILKVFLSVSNSCLPKPFLTEADVANLECRDRPCFYRFPGLRVGSSSVRQRSWELHPMEVGAPSLMLLHPDFPIKISALHPCGTNSVHPSKSETSTWPQSSSVKPAEPQREHVKIISVIPRDDATSENNLSHPVTVFCVHWYVRILFQDTPEDAG